MPSTDVGKEMFPLSQNLKVRRRTGWGGRGWGGILFGWVLFFVISPPPTTPPLTARQTQTQDILLVHFGLNPAGLFCPLRN